MLKILMTKKGLSGFDEYKNFAKISPRAEKVGKPFNPITFQFFVTFLYYRHFSRRRFTYRERAMNRIIVEQEQAFVNKRAILLPKTHDVNKYELQPERHYDDEDDEDEDGEDGEYRDRRDHHHQQHGRFPPRRHTRDYDDLEPDRTRRRSRPFTTRDHMERRMTRDELDQDHEDEDFQLDPATPKRNSIIDY